MRNSVWRVSFGLVALMCCFWHAFSVQSLVVSDTAGLSMLDVKNNGTVAVIESADEMGQAIQPHSRAEKKLSTTQLIALQNYGGLLDVAQYQEHNVNELGKVPILMYHGIVDKKNDDMPYVGGNADRHGYHRTAEAFRADLEFFYQAGYRVISLEDYLRGAIDLPLGKSPLVLTFDDGFANNIRVLGKDDDGELIIDDNSAVGIMEEFRKKYPDFNVTATFFLNQPLFHQFNYNDDIVAWLIANGYDVGNHSYSHDNLSQLSADEVQAEIGRMDKLLNEVTNGENLNVLATPYGRPYEKTHDNFPYLLQGAYQNYDYQNFSVLQAGWKPNYSPFDKRFDQTFVKRVKAYDNNGYDYDLEATFADLDDNRYIASGLSEVVVVPSEMLPKVATERNVLLYE